MEHPLVPGGTATFTRSRNTLEISVLSEKQVAGGCFLCFWLCGWLMGELFASFALCAPKTPLPVRFFLLFWLSFWTFGGLMAMYTAVRSLMDRQVITLTSRNITITAVLWFLRIPLRFSLGKVRNVRPEEGGTSMNNIIKDTGKTLLAFEYGRIPIKSLVAMEPRETFAMMSMMKESGFLTPEHFNPAALAEMEQAQNEGAQGADPLPPAEATDKGAATVAPSEEEVEIDEEVTEYEDGEPESR
ncbi:MAG: hypothetical protein RDV48_11195 [Candidatus Eremiobacteraeota bacterium]|nr:hypothetical protein [Candidatus Eremiobacteraeota bacterium]